MNMLLYCGRAPSTLSKEWSLTAPSNSLEDCVRTENDIIHTELEVNNSIKSVSQGVHLEQSEVKI